MLKNNKYYPLALQFSRYVAVGGIAFLIDFLVLTGALDLGFHYILATAIAFTVGLLVNYCLCVLWVWSGTQAKSIKDIFIFSLIGAGGLFITTCLMWLFVGFLSFDAKTSKVLVATIVLFWNFGLRRVFVFFK